MSNKKFHNPAAIMLVGNAKAYITRGTFLGDNAKIIAKGNSQFFSQDSTHISTDVIALYVSMESELFKQKGNLKESEYQKLLNELQMLNKHQGKPSFPQAYKGFVASLSDHATVLTAFAPYIAQLAQHL